MLGNRIFQPILDQSSSQPVLEFNPILNKYIQDISEPLHKPKVLDETSNQLVTLQIQNMVEKKDAKYY